MKLKYIIVCVVLTVLFASFYYNRKYEVIAFNPFYESELHDLKVMTWNVHCSLGADHTKQQAIAKLILKEDADFVLLNEFFQDSCFVIDSILSTRYEFTEERKSHRKSGDIFFCKRIMMDTGRVPTPQNMKRIKTIKATIAVGDDSIQIFGLHMASNHYDDNSLDENIKSDNTSFNRYKDAQKNRCYQAYWTKEAAVKSRHPVIVMGDMNDFNCSAPLDILASCGLKDAWWEGGNGYGATFHDGLMRLRIDHILHSKELRLESIKVIETDLSDHNPVVAGFSVKKN